MVIMKRLNSWATLGLLAMCLTMVACTPVAPKVEKMKAPISCQQAQYDDYATVSDQRLVQFINQSAADEDSNQCWRPSMVAALQQQRPLEQHHLLDALKAFNQRRDRELFHLAVGRYLANLSLNDYRSKQRQLLIAYSRYLIDHAQSNADPRLAEIKVLCAELDQDLYHKLFE